MLISRVPPALPRLDSLPHRPGPVLLPAREQTQVTTRHARRAWHPTRAEGRRGGCLRRVVSLALRSSSAVPGLRSSPNSASHTRPCKSLSSSFSLAHLSFSLYVIHSASLTLRMPRPDPSPSPVVLACWPTLLYKMSLLMRLPCVSLDKPREKAACAVSARAS